MSSKRSIAIINRLGVPKKIPPEIVTDGCILNFIETLIAYTKAGWKVDVFTSSVDGISSIDRFESVKIHRLNVQLKNVKHISIIDSAFEEGMSFARSLLNYEPFLKGCFSIWHTHHWASALLPVLMIRPKGTFHIHTPHLLLSEKSKFLPETPTSPALTHEKALISAAHRIVALSVSEKNQICRTFNKSEDDVVVIPNGITSDFFKENHQQSNNSIPKVLTVGRIAQQKGLHILLKAISHVRQSRPIKAVIIGDSYRYEDMYAESLQTNQIDYGLVEDVVFAGPKNHQEIAAVLSTTDIYIQPSFYESQGIAILEAMAAGVPVIASRMEATEDYIVDGHSGILCPVGKPKDLALAIERLLDDTNDYHYLKHLGR